jgi:FkbM family methyltransferase
MNIINKIKYLISDYKYLNLSYSQEGEDLFLLRYFNYRPTGFYVDVGAHHPKRYSNTYAFYQLGWQGINIDAMPDSMKAFNKSRSRDINLELGVSEKADELTYHIFNESALNTFSKEEAQGKDGKHHYKVEATKTISTLPLAHILEQYLPKNQPIDFISIDVEGLDLQVIYSNNWEKFRPHLVLIEDLKRASLDKMEEGEVYQEMKKLNYVPIGRTLSTIVFKDVL